MHSYLDQLLCEICQCRVVFQNLLFPSFVYFGFIMFPPSVMRGGQVECVSFACVLFYLVCFIYFLINVNWAVRKAQR